MQGGRCGGAGTGSPVPTAQLLGSAKRSGPGPGRLESEPSRALCSTRTDEQPTACQAPGRASPRTGWSRLPSPFPHLLSRTAPTGRSPGSQGPGRGGRSASGSLRTAGLPSRKPGRAFRLAGTFRSFKVAGRGAHSPRGVRQLPCVPLTSGRGRREGRTSRVSTTGLSDRPGPGRRPDLRKSPRLSRHLEGLPRNPLGHRFPKPALRGRDRTSPALRGKRGSTRGGIPSRRPRPGHGGGRER